MNTVCCIFIRAPTNGVHYFASNVTLQHMATQPILCNSVRSGLPIYKRQVCQKCPLMKQRSNFLLHDNNCIILIANRIIYSWDHILQALVSPKITNANLNIYILRGHHHSRAFIATRARTVSLKLDMGYL